VKTRLLTILTSGLCLLLSAVANAYLPTDSPEGAWRFSQNFCDFSNTSALSLNGTATTTTTSDGVVLRLTPALRERQTGTAFSQELVDVANFSTSFKFRITDSGGWGGGADGLVFVVQAVSADIVGGGGEGIGYTGISNSVGIEFDTYYNSFRNDPNDNHIGIRINGAHTHDVGSTVEITPSFKDGNLWFAWINYDGNSLEVRVNQSGIRPEEPTMTQLIDISDILGGVTKAFVGFTSGTWEGSGNHDIISWECEPDIDSDGDGMPDSFENQYLGEVMFEDHFEDGTLDSAWVMKRTYWEEADGKLKTVPEVLPGFNYGHWGNGRTPLIVLHEGDPTWTDYSYEFTCSSLGVVSEFNLHGLPIGFRGGMGTGFRVQEHQASWNEPANYLYWFSILVSDTDSWEVGDWKISGYDGTYIPGTGWTPNFEGTKYIFAEGNSPAINPDSQPNHVNVLVKENKMYAWVNGVVIGEAVDPLNISPYGGISFATHWEAMGWFDDVIVRSVGLNPNIPDAHLDYDNDGFTNLEEYQNNTNPMVPDNAQPGTPQFTNSTVEVAETASTVTLTVRRVGGTNGELTVNYATTDGTATDGSDYIGATGTLTWADGDSSDKTFTVTITDDSLSEGNETFTISLETLDSATVTIVDNESTLVTLASFTATGLENSIEIVWITYTEFDSIGFHLWRATGEGWKYGDYSTLTRLTDQLIPAEGNSGAGATYSYIDSDVESGLTYYYGLEDRDGTNQPTYYLDDIDSATAK